MKRKYYLFITLFLLFLTPMALAHVPQKSNINDSLERSLHVEEPLKSWVFYSELNHSEDARYYELHLDAGDKLKLSIITPEEDPFSPKIVLMSENIDSIVQIPGYVETYEGYGTFVFGGERGEAEFEPFTPGAYFSTAEHTEILENGGEYYIIVYEEDGRTGSFGLVVGYQELFSPIEIIRVPWDAIWIHRWEGQSYTMIFYPMIIIALAGILFIYKKMKSGRRPTDLIGWIIASIGLVYIGSGAIFINQIGYSVMKSGYSNMIILSAIIALIPMILGSSMMRFGYSERKGVDAFVRIRPLLYGVLGLFTWSGLIIFPAICMIISFLPSSLLSMYNE